MAESLQVDVPAERGEITQLAEAVEQLGDREQWSGALVFKANLVIEELVLNTMTHGRHDGAMHISVAIDSAPESVKIAIIDNGKPFDPLSDAPEPDLDSAVTDRAVGGLGIHMVIEMVDSVSYGRIDGQNRLTMELSRVD